MQHLIHPVKKVQTSEWVISKEIIAFTNLGITEEKLNEIGLHKAKQLAKQHYREKAFRIHPDTAKVKDSRRPGMSSMMKLCRWIKIINDTKYLPITSNNAERVLKISKGFKTTEDIDIGLNNIL